MLTDQPPKRPGRNERCPCGSGKKYKQCCLAKDRAADSATLAEAAKSAPSAATVSESDAEKSPTRAPKPQDRAQPWKRDQQQARVFHKRSGPRKRGGS
ncbi:MAG: SEC-C metal-binding domain-containing protein [Acidobacteriota bacterium]|nr:SEC-C metal-binding domain-containing protein [Acidobacteriota bacterium]